MGKIVKVFFGGYNIAFEPNSLPKIGQIIVSPQKQNYGIVEAIIDQSTVGCVLIQRGNDEPAINDEVINTKKPIMVPVGSETMGQIFNVLGNCLNKDHTHLNYIPINSTIKDHDQFDEQYQLMETGIKVIDFLCPIIKGTKIGISGGPGVGKTVLIKELIHNFS